MLLPSRTVRQRIAIVVIVAVGIGVLLLIAPYAGGLLLALVLHVLVAPVYRRLVAHVPHGVASAVVIIGLIVLLVVPVAWLITIVVAQLPDALRGVQDTDLLAYLTAFRLGPFDLGALIGGMGQTTAGWLATQATALLGGAASTLLNLIISLFALHYLLRSGASTWHAVRPFIPFSREHSDELLDQFKSTTRGTVLGSLLIAIIQGALVGLAFLATGLSGAAIWGVVATVASLIPVFGSGIVWVPGVITVALRGSYVTAIVMAAFCGIVVASIDNFVRPVVNQRISAVHPMITLIGAFAGIRVFGLLGLILGPLSISYFFVLLRMYREEYSQPPAATGGTGAVGQPQN
jgi:predicted PurR-regulated permease PerM